MGMLFFHHRSLLLSPSPLFFPPTLFSPFSTHAHPAQQPPAQQQPPAATSWVYVGKKQLTVEEKKEADGQQQHSSISNRVVGGFDRFKSNWEAARMNWDRHIFMDSVFGPSNTWFVPQHEASEWGFILFLFYTRSYRRVIRLSLVTVGSVLIPPLGVVLYARFLFSRYAVEKVRYVGERYVQRNIDADEDWWYLNGTGVNTGMSLHTPISRLDH